MRRHLLLVFSVLLGCVVLFAGGVGLFLLVADLRPHAERLAARSLGRPVAIGELKIAWGRRTEIAAKDIVLANVEWGSEPGMVRIGRLAATVDLASLLRGVLRYEHLRLDDVSVLLERRPDGAPNWKLGRTPARPPKGGLALVPANRTQFPCLLDFVLVNGTVVYRNAGRADIVIAVHNGRIAAPDETTPASLRLDGSYNGAAVKLSASTASFAVMRNASVRFTAVLDLVTDGTTAHFEGTLREPLDFDGAAGMFSLRSVDLGKLLAKFGSEAPMALPLALNGELVRNGDDWRAERVNGRLATSDFAGALALHEGGRGQPDLVHLDLASRLLDIAALLAGRGSGAGADVPFGFVASPGTLFEGRVVARTAVWNRLQVENLTMAGRTGPGLVQVETLNFGIARGLVETKLQAKAAADGARVVASASLSGAEIGGLLQMVGGSVTDLEGKLDGRLNLEMQGRTLQSALGASRGQAVLAMQGGSMSRALLEKASTDLRALFRPGQGSAPVVCLLAVADLKDGLATVSPLRLRTPDTVLSGSGTVNVPQATLDLVIASEGGGALALGIPLHVGGDLATPSIGPGMGAPPRLPGPPALPPALLAMVSANPCRL